MPERIPSQEVTSHRDYLNRRQFLKRAGILTASVVGTGWVYQQLNRIPAVHRPRQFATTLPTTQKSIPVTMTVNEPLTSFDDITHYNNFYEFSTDKQEVAELAAGFVSRPWTVSVGGLCRKPTRFDLDDLIRLMPIEERVYRMRCVEAWSMVIPWDGFQLSKLLDRVEPLSNARYVAFTTVVDKKQMPNQRRGDVLDWPYVEGLRIDEAMHKLTLLATGIYGQTLPPQDGAPIRLVVPWKYGFKGCKSIVKIDLVADQPPTTWNLYASDEYGFYANVNPTVDHPRWSQAHERRIGGDDDKPTLMFNGYGDEVGSLYAGMDLRRNF